MDTLKQRLVDQQDHSTRSTDLQLFGIPEGTEKDDPVSFLKWPLQVMFPSLVNREIEIERTHRIYSILECLFSSFSYVDRDLILCQSGNHGPVHPDDGGYTEFLSDYSPTTAKKHIAFTVVRKELRERGIPNFLQLPATLKVILNLQSPNKVCMFCDSLPEVCH